jgi:hypothetical protein
VEQEGRLLVITLCRPAVRNAIDRATSQALADAMDRLDRDDGITVGILTGDVKSSPDAQIVVLTQEILRNRLFKIGTATASFGSNTTRPASHGAPRSAGTSGDTRPRRRRPPSLAARCRPRRSTTSGSRWPR